MYCYCYKKIIWYHLNFFQAKIRNLTRILAKTWCNLSKSGHKSLEKFQQETIKRISSHHHFTQSLEEHFWVSATTATREDKMILPTKISVISILFLGFAGTGEHFKPICYIVHKSLSQNLLLKQDFMSKYRLGSKIVLSQGFRI